MSTKSKEDELQQNSNEEETNQLNALKDEEFLKKVNEKSHLQNDIIVNDPYLTSNSEVNCSLSNEWNTAKFPDFVVDFTSQNKTSFPIDKYLSNQTEDNIFYQHPNLINEDESYVQKIRDELLDCALNKGVDISKMFDNEDSNWINEYIFKTK